MRDNKILHLIEGELIDARSKHGDLNSYHEGYAFILDALDELWDEIKKRQPDQVLMLNECVQVAAMVHRFIADLLDVEI